ncbi:gluconate 2-dehydrogenase subunit 3 family protein [Herbaspirillum sp. LeCh32-8]|uniref:gluconate 2-dehydrogenase subunit 3 family protein n=1 Tax=Herbaspirillum sp. LeCh32-8 TaxID=2821356 RepID=UPI001AE25692|nr:gluconate 2-dehydrogenase subunit 3 family protein [Herbaspirillum sp. LeCh32-8]MBP0598114.1 gluconate 2-dehydrogenase subunit 3 family protein [Herbaspirillum sp. LeCh32-8]
MSKTKFSPSRRAVLAATAAAVPIVSIPMFKQAQAEGLEGIELQHYKPVFFSDAEWIFILAACDRLIPAEGRGPGALETNVPVFIDQQLKGGLGNDIYQQGPHPANPAPTLGFQIPHTPQDLYRTGIKLAQEASRQQYGKPFDQLDAKDKDALLTGLQKNTVDFAALGVDTMKASQFFGQLLGDTKNGYLADPMYGGNKDMKAWVAIGFPGARAAYTEWVDQHNVKYPLGPVSLSGKRA